MKRKQAGYTILELIVVIVLSAILFGMLADQLTNMLFLHRRQQRLMQAEQEVAAIQLRLAQSLRTVPGREIGYYSGKEFVIPTLPANGILNQKPIQLGLVTPYKVNGQDAVAIVYGRRDVPRLELVAESQDNNNNRGTALATANELTDPSREPGDYFTNNKFMLLVGSEAYDQKTAKLPKHFIGRLVRLTARAKRHVQGGTPIREVIQLDYDLCDSGACGTQYPSLINTNATTQLSKFGMGSTLVLLEAINIYVQQGTNRAQVMRNDGGSILPGSNGDFQVVGGTNSFIGEADTFQISYVLDTGVTEPTPLDPLVKWLDQVTTVRVQLSRAIPSVKGNEVLSRTATVDLPVVIRNFD